MNVLKRRRKRKPTTILQSGRDKPPPPLPNPPLPSTSTSTSTSTTSFDKPLTSDSKTQQNYYKENSHNVNNKRKNGIRKGGPTGKFKVQRTFKPKTKKAKSCDKPTSSSNPSKTTTSIPTSTSSSSSSTSQYNSTSSDTKTHLANIPAAVVNIKKIKDMPFKIPRKIKPTTIQRGRNKPASSSNPTTTSIPTSTSTSSSSTSKISTIPLKRNNNSNIISNSRPATPTNSFSSDLLSQASSSSSSSSYYASVPPWQPESQNSISFESQPFSQDQENPARSRCYTRSSKQPESQNSISFESQNSSNSIQSQPLSQEKEDPTSKSPVVKEVTLASLLNDSLLLLEKYSTIKTGNIARESDKSYIKEYLGTDMRIYTGDEASRRERQENQENQETKVALNKTTIERLLMSPEISKSYRRSGVIEPHDFQIQALLKINNHSPLTINNDFSNSNSNSSQLPSSYTALNGSNIILQAPTGGGKSLIAEILMVRKLFQSQDETLRIGQKIIYVVPKRSLVTSVVTKLQRTFQKATNQYIRVEGFYGHRSTADKRKKRMTSQMAFDGKDVHVIICTTELAVSLIEHIEIKDTFARLTAVVIDEANFLDLGDPRGVKMLNVLAIMMAAPNGEKIQIIAMSATFLKNQLEDLSKWMKAVEFVHGERGVHIDEHILTPKTSWLKQKLPKQSVGFIQASSSSSSSSLAITLIQKNIRTSFIAQKVLKQLCNTPLFKTAIDITAKNVIENKKQVLVFCNTKKTVEKFGQILSQHLKSVNISKSLDIPQEELRKTLKEETGSDNVSDVPIDNLVGGRVGIHHAGLDEKTKLVMEQGFKDGILNVLVATSTLSEGVNLPCAVVVIVSAELYSDGAMQLMGMSDYLQRIGRAGRSEFGGNKVEPKSYLVTDGDEKQLHHAKLLLKEKVLKKRVTFKPDPDDLAYFAKWEAFDRMLLCRIISGEPQDENSSVVNSVKMLTLVKLVKHSFWYHLHCQHQESNGGVIDMERSNIDDNVHSCIRKSVLRLADPESYDQNKQMIKIDMPKIKNFQQYEDGTRKYLYYSFSDKWSFRPTPLGKAIVISSLPVQESITLFKWLSTKTISVFNKLPTLSLVVPIYVRFIELKGKPKSEFTMLAWQNMTNSFQRLTQNQKESLITMGYRDEVVEHILRGGWYSSNTSELLKTYERIAKTLILNDACEKPNPSGRRKLATKHKLSQGKLDQALLESAKMCGKIKIFCEQTNFSIAKGLFGKDLRTKLLPLSDISQSKLTNAGIGNEEDTFQLQIAGISTPEEFAAAKNFDKMVIVLKKNHKINKEENDQQWNERLQNLALEYQSKARRHLKRMRNDDSDDDEDGDDMDIDE